MARITFITPDNERITLDESFGSVMELAVDNDIQGIEARCRGCCSCGTCHVKVSEEWADQLPGREADEESVLDMHEGTGPCSRLSCQLEITDELDGLVVEVVPLDD